VGKVAQSGRGMLLPGPRAYDEAGFDAVADARAGRPTPSSLLILPIIYDPKNEHVSPGSSSNNSRASSSVAAEAMMQGVREQQAHKAAAQSEQDQRVAAVAADPEFVRSVAAVVNLPPSAKVIGVVLAIMDAPQTGSAAAAVQVVHPSTATPNPSVPMLALTGVAAIPAGLRSPMRSPRVTLDDRVSDLSLTSTSSGVSNEGAARVFGPDDERLLRSICAQAAFSLIKSQQLTRLVEDASQSEKKSDIAGFRSSAVVDGVRSSGVIDLASDDIDPFHFRISEIEIIETIGSGSFGEVYAAKLRGQIVAVKKLNARGMKAEHVDAFCNEASLMCQLKHPNLVRFVGAIPQPPDLCIITEYCARGSLCDILLDHTIPLTFGDKLKMSLEAAAGMTYMHKSNPVILHRDLKSDNLLVTGDMQIKVADFGLSRFRSDRKTMTQVGTPMWMAPEVIIGEKYTEKADVYSFGIILWEIMTRMEPYPDKEAMQIVLQVVKDGLRPTIPMEYVVLSKRDTPC
jgi:hypothetical protein